MPDRAARTSHSTGEWGAGAVPGRLVRGSESRRPVAGLLHASSKGLCRTAAAAALVRQHVHAALAAAACKPHSRAQVMPGTSFDFAVAPASRVDTEGLSGARSACHCLTAESLVSNPAALALLPRARCLLQSK